ncbi:MAG TPA: GNAT family N-acetyltransferase [Aggregatilineales bacterium]|nr:GNAT family N-acetyltransferase [Anaerolineales bacterium]HRE47681.1 GNAT family N-acetyltransferase [Aggregatilineales bacterium]
MTNALRDKRAEIATRLDITSPADAPTAYYALYHDPSRSTLVTAARGFAGRFQTGVDLFRPLITLGCLDAETAANLLSQIALPGRPYMFFAPLNQLPLVGGSMQISGERILTIHVLDRAQFRSEMNILVRRSSAPDGSPRAEISAETGERRVRAIAGVNWESAGFAELYVEVDPGARQKGWGRSVLVALIEAVLAGGRLPLYLVEPTNEASLRLAHSVGFQETGARQVYADAIYLGHPGKR